MPQMEYISPLITDANLVSPLKDQKKQIHTTLFIQWFCGYSDIEVIKSIWKNTHIKPACVLNIHQFIKHLSPTPLAVVLEHVVHYCSAAHLWTKKLGTIVLVKSGGWKFIFVPHATLKNLEAIRKTKPVVTLSEEKRKHTPCFCFLHSNGGPTWSHEPYDPGCISWLQSLSWLLSQVWELPKFSESLLAVGKMKKHIAS